MGRKPKSSLFDNAINQLLTNNEVVKKSTSISLSESLLNELEQVAKEYAGGNKSRIVELCLSDFLKAFKSEAEKRKREEMKEIEK